MFSFERNYFLSLLLIAATGSHLYKGGESVKAGVKEHRSLYNELHLKAIGLNQNVFEKAITGWEELNQQQQLPNPDIISIADLSQSSNSKRLYIIDMVKKTVLINTYVAHGRNSGGEFANSFANQPESNKSSLGFYITGNTYNGHHGLSLKLKGVEKGINDFAEQRAIVMHGADYVSESFIRQFGRLGRSQGCPAIPAELCEPVINTIKNGSCLFIFYPDKTYLRQSRLL